MFFVIDYACFCALDVQSGTTRYGFGVPTFNAGETTIGVELARALKRICMDAGRKVEIVFAAPCTDARTYDDQVTNAGFPLEHIDLHLSAERIRAMFEVDHAVVEPFTDREEPKNYIEHALFYLHDRKPELV